MSCCGSKRQAFLPPQNNFSADHQERPIVYVKFRYTGKSSMSVTGGMTGHRYRFLHPGDEVMVDARDAPGMGAVPNVVFSV